MTPVYKNAYNFNDKVFVENQLPFTNGTTRKIEFRELVVIENKTGQYFAGFCATPDGVAAGASGHFDLFPEHVVSTNQFTAGAFATGEVGVWVTPQDNSGEAKIVVASASGALPLAAYIKSYNASGNIELRMPVQDGTAALVA